MILGSLLLRFGGVFLVRTRLDSGTRFDHGIVDSSALVVGDAVGTVDTIINLVFGFSVPNISNAGHIGGLLSGFVAGFALFMMQRRPPEPVVVDAATGEESEAELLPPQGPAHSA